MRTYAKICVILLLLIMAVGLLSACAADREPMDYLPKDHVHTYGYWYDAAPANGGTATEEVRYCRICHAEEVRLKE